MLKRKDFDGESSPKKWAKRPETGPLNDVDPITLEVLTEIEDSELVRVEDADGWWMFRRTSISDMIRMASIENQPILNPFNGRPLYIPDLPHSPARFPDSLREEDAPSRAHTEKLIVDVCIRLGRHGVFVLPAVLMQQRTGRMKRIASAIQLFFSQFLKPAERAALAPPCGQLSTKTIGWANWAMWGQQAMLLVARCSGERSDAQSVLKKRGAELALAALAYVIPEIGREYQDSLSITIHI